MEPQYEEQFTAFIDFLGFEEFSKKADDGTRARVLDLLVTLAGLRGEFNFESKAHESGISTSGRPAISTFSDHIVISYPLQPMTIEGKFDEDMVAVSIFNHFTWLVTTIAAEALRIGFLIRGGATIGKLYHAGGVVFGDAMVEAYRLESRTAVYPRIVLSPTITERPGWIEKTVNVAKDNDGLHHIDYFQLMLPEAARQGEKAGELWYKEAIAVVAQSLKKSKDGDDVDTLAKWAWFARQFRTGLETLEKRNPHYFKLLAGDLNLLPWSI
jgi:hypothetical protein